MLTSRFCKLFTVEIASRRVRKAFRKSNIGRTASKRSPIKTAVLFNLLALATGSSAQTRIYADLHDFGGTVLNADGVKGADGFWPQAGVTFDSAGNMYGTTAEGGPYAKSYSNSGMVWEITKAGIYKDLHDFGGTVINANGVSGPDGWWPTANVTVDSEGNLYGTTGYGGPNYATSGNGGNLWEITAAGKYIDLHDFGGVIKHSNGTTSRDGFHPDAAISFDSAGNMYGTTYGGGAAPGEFNGGMVWKLTKAGVYSDLHDFGLTVINANGKSGPDGNTPEGGVTIDANLNLYGTATAGGANHSSTVQGGIVWEITKAGAYKDLHDFGGTTLNANGKSGPDGLDPEGNVAVDSSGNLYGTAFTGGPNDPAAGGFGLVWEISVAGVYKDLHDFGSTITLSTGASGLDGEKPESGVVLGPGGDLYGTASTGGGHGEGLIWDLSRVSGYKDLHDFGADITVASGATAQDGTEPLDRIKFDGAGNLYGTTYYEGGENGGMVWTIGTGVKSLSVSTATPVGGTSVTATLTLGAAAPVGGWVIALSSSNANAKVPAKITVPAGSVTATFPVTTSPVTAATAVTITATQPGNTAKATCNIEPPVISGFSLSPSTLVGGASSTATISIDGTAPTGGITITLSSNSTHATLPKTVTIAAGQKSAQVTIKTTPVTATTTATLTAVSGSKTLTAPLVINK